MAELGGKRFIEDSPEAFKIMPRYEIGVGGEVGEDEQPAADEENHHTNSHELLVKKVKEQTNKVKEILKQSHDHDRHNRYVPGDHGYDEDEHKEYDELLGYNMHSSESMEEVTKALSGLDTFGTRDIFKREDDALVKNTDWTSVESNLGAAGHDLHALPSQGETARQQQRLPSARGRVSDGVTPFLQTIHALSIVDPDIKVERNNDGAPAPAQPEKKFQKIERINVGASDYVPASAHDDVQMESGDSSGTIDAQYQNEKRLVFSDADHTDKTETSGVTEEQSSEKGHNGQDQSVQEAVRDSNEVVARAMIPTPTTPCAIIPTSTTSNVKIPIESIKPIEKTTMESSIQWMNEDRENAEHKNTVSTERKEVQTEVDSRSINHETAEEAMAKNSESTLRLGREKQVDEEEKPVSSKVQELIAGGKDIVMGSDGSGKGSLSASKNEHRESDSGKPRGEWALEEIKYAKGKLGESISTPVEQKTFTVKELNFSNGKESEGMEKSLRNEETENAHEGGHSAPTEMGTDSILGKAIGLTLGLKDVFQFELGATNNNNSNSSPESEGHLKEKTEKINKEAEQNVHHNEESKSYRDKIYETASTAKNAVAAKLGYGGQQESVEDGSLAGKDTKLDHHDETGTESKEALKDIIIDKLSPGEEDKALSEVITDKVSHSAVSVKDSIAGVFSRVSDSSTEMSEEGHTKGIEERVSGVVGLGKIRTINDNTLLTN